MMCRGLAAISVAAAAALGGVAHAQTFPARAIILIVPWVAGGPTDVAMRAIAGAAEKHLGQAIVIENRPGAAGTLGPMQMATANPDGYTIAQIPVNVFRAPFMRQTTFDPIKDLTYIIRLTSYSFGVVVRRDAPWKTIQEFLAAARANPGKITFGSPGVGGGVHVGMVRIAKHEGIDWIHVPFRGSAEATIAILGGHVDAIGDPSAAQPLANGEALRVLVTWGARRSTNWPMVPTLREIGIDVVANEPYGLAGPKGMDPNVVKILHDAFKRGLEDPSCAAVLAQLDQGTSYLDSKAYHDFAIEEVREQQRVVEQLGLKQE
jgi:tripartite-type tricarboxylate transporter receptor subunit TctC